MVRNLRDNLANGDSITVFEQRVDSFPDDLHGFIMRMLEDIPKIYQAASARTLRMMMTAQESGELLELITTLLDL